MTLTMFLWQWKVFLESTFLILNRKKQIQHPFWNSPKSLRILIWYWFFFNLQPFTKGISNLKTVSLDLKTHRWQSWIVIVVLHILPSLCFQHLLMSQKVMLLDATSRFLMSFFASMFQVLDTVSRLLKTWDDKLSTNICTRWSALFS